MTCAVVDAVPAGALGIGGIVAVTADGRANVFAGVGVGIGMIFRSYFGFL